LIYSLIPLLDLQKARLVFNVLLMKCCLLIPDTHIPYHDIKAYKLMLEVAKDIKIDEIYILGDYADFYAVSSHGKDPSVASILIDEISSVLECLNELDANFKNVKKFYLQGNHEWRLERYLNDQAAALFGITSTEHLLEINRRVNWKFIGYGPNQSIKVGDSFLTARHEPLASSAKATAAKALCSLTYGHIHRIEESHIVGLDGINHVCFSVGWLGDKRQDKIYGYVKSHHQWQLGFGIVYVDPKTKYFYHQKIHIMNNYTCVVNGKSYKA